VRLFRGVNKTVGDFPESLAERFDEQLILALECL